MQTVVMASQEDAFGAVRILTEREAGRLSVIPLDALKPVYPLNLHNERGVVGVAAKLVRPEPRFKALFDTLLGRTIVVEDLEVARRMIQRGLGSVVTLEASSPSLWRGGWWSDAPGHVDVQLGGSAQ